MIARSHGDLASAVQSVHVEEDVNTETTARVDSVDRLDSVDSVVSSQVVRLVDSVYVAIIP